MSKVAVGLSGGVDSGVSAYLLKEQGMEVVGIYVDMLSEKYGFCRTVTDAQRVAEQLGIEFYILDGRAAFEEKVVHPFMEEYYSGRTPSPCLNCNRYIKFGIMAQFAEDLGCDFLATGHYVGTRKREDGSYALVCGEDRGKDQSYFLSGIEEKWLKRLVFPLAKYTKSEVRAIGERIGLVVANKPDSQEICFVADNDYKKFLATYSGRESHEGNFVNRNGDILGKHKGVENYTIGQRKGLGIALGKPQYVVKIDGKKNEVVLGDNEDLFFRRLLAKDNHFLKKVPVGEEIAIKAKVRYRAQMAEGVLFRINEELTQLEFKEPQRAITPGQGVCYYTKEDEVLGGGTIVEVIEG